MGPKVCEVRSFLSSTIRQLMEDAVRLIHKQMSGKTVSGVDSDTLVCTLGLRQQQGESDMNWRLRMLTAQFGLRSL